MSADAPRSLALLCAGAAHGLVRALQDEVEAATGLAVTGRFGPVGAMRDALLSGAPCDVLVVTSAIVEALAASGHVRGETRADLGRVRTGMAVRQGAPLPALDPPPALRDALLAADALYFPDPERATAGIHFTGVLRTLGIHDAVAARCRVLPSGAAAMAELERAGTPRSLGCTQITEIRDATGLVLAGALPPPFELATTYTAVVAAGSTQPAAAADVVARLAGPSTQALRRARGFDVDG